MKHVHVVIGANYGDEGKGATTDALCRSIIGHKAGKCLNVMNNGGVQRGHTVVDEKLGRHIFHALGSGTFAGADTYMPSQFIINPAYFIKEYNEVKKAMEAFGRKMPNVIVSGLCRVQVPGDIAANQIREIARGKMKHGSCGIGIWETVNRYRRAAAGDGRLKEALAFYTFEDLLKMPRSDCYSFITSATQYQFDLAVAEMCLLENDADVDELKKTFLNCQFIQHWVDDLHEMGKVCRIVKTPIIEEYDHIVVECAQGLMLDPKYGATEKRQSHFYDCYTDMSYTTPSRTGSAGLQWLLNMVNLSNEKFETHHWYVTRPYLTRHGADPHFKEDDALQYMLINKDTTNVPNDWQGSMRFGELEISGLCKRIYDDQEDFIKAIHQINLDNDMLYNANSSTVNVVATHCDEMKLDYNHDGLSMELYNKKWTNIPLYRVSSPDFSLDLK